MSMVCRGAKGCALSSFVDHIIGAVDRAGSTMPMDFKSTDELLDWFDTTGAASMKDILDWQPKLAEVIVMTKRRRRAKR